MKSMEKAKYSASDNLQPADIITEHIRKIMNDEDISHYMSDIEKLEDLLMTEIDSAYKTAEKEIEEKVKNFSVGAPGRLNRENAGEFRRYVAAKQGQYRMRLIFRELVRLAKRKGLWLTDEEEAHISHDKKKATSTA